MTFIITKGYIFIQLRENYSMILLSDFEECTIIANFSNGNTIYEIRFSRHFMTLQFRVISLASTNGQVSAELSPC